MGYELRGAGRLTIGDTAVCQTALRRKLDLGGGFAQSMRPLVMFSLPRGTRRLCALRLGVIRFVLISPLALALLVTASSVARERGVPASEGIINFGKVSEKLFR